MHTTIRDILGAAAVGATPAKKPSPTPQPGNKFAGQPGNKTVGVPGGAQPGNKMAPKPGQPAGGQQPGLNGQPQGIGIDQVAQQSMQPQMPQHELNVDHPTNMHDPEDAQTQFNFLKQAMGGPQDGFVTTTSKSHAVAHKLAKSGHLMKVQEAKLGNGHTKMHWQLTQKGVGAVGQTQNQAGRRR
jgi:hypothetical protein